MDLGYTYFKPATLNMFREPNETYKNIKEDMRQHCINSQSITKDIAFFFKKKGGQIEILCLKSITSEMKNSLCVSTIDFDWKKRISEPKLSPIGNMQSAKQSKRKTKGTSEKCRTPLIPLRDE